jgi:hypothetical protein
MVVFIIVLDFRIVFILIFFDIKGNYQKTNGNTIFHLMNLCINCNIRTFQKLKINNS